MTRLLALAALAAVISALVLIVGGGIRVAVPEPAAAARTAAPSYPMLDEDGGLPDRAAVRRAVRRAVLRERRRNEARATRERVAEVRRAVARTRAALLEERRSPGRRAAVRAELR